MSFQAGNISRDDEILYSLPALNSLSKNQLSDLCVYYGLPEGGKREHVVDRLITYGHHLLTEPGRGPALETEPATEPATEPPHPLFTPQASKQRPSDSVATRSWPIDGSPVERMTIPRLPSFQRIRPPARPNTVNGRSGLSSRSSFTLNSLLPRSKLEGSVPFEGSKRREPVTRNAAEETWDMIDVGDTSVVPGFANDVNTGRGPEKLFDQLGRKISSAHYPEKTATEGEMGLPATSRNVSHSQTWNGHSARKDLGGASQGRHGGSLGWKSAVNGGNGYAVSEESDEFGRKGVGNSILGRRSMKSLKNMASHISLRRAATSSFSGLSRRASTNILGRNPSTSTLLSAATHPYRQDSVKSGKYKYGATEVRPLPPLKSAFATPDQPGILAESAELADSSDRAERIEVIADPPSPAPTETVGIARRHRGSVMAGPSTIRLISQGPAQIATQNDSDVTPKPAEKRRLRKGASIPNMFGAGAAQPHTDSPDVPRLPPLRLSTFPVDDSLSFASRLSSVASDEEPGVFEVPLDAPPMPTTYGQREDTSGLLPDIVSPVFPGGFPSMAIPYKKQDLGQLARSDCGFRFDLPSSATTAPGDQRKSSSATMKPLPQIPMGRREGKQGATTRKRKGFVEGDADEYKSATSDAKKARLVQGRNDLGQPKPIDGARQMGGNDPIQDIVGAITGRISSFAKRLSSGPEVLLHSPAPPTDTGMIPGDFAGSLLRGNLSSQSTTARGPQNSGGNKLKKASSTSNMLDTKADRPPLHTTYSHRTDRSNLPGPSTQHPLRIKGSMACKLSMGQDYKKSSRAAPELPGVYLAEKRSTEMPSKGDRDTSTGSRTRRAEDEWTAGPDMRELAVDMTANRNLPDDRSAPSKGPRPLSSSGQIPDGAPQSRTKRTNDHPTNSPSRSRPALQKSGSPRRKGASTLSGPSGLKSKTSKVGLETSKRHHAMMEARRREEAEKGLEAFSGKRESLVRGDSLVEDVDVRSEGKP